MTTLSSFYSSLYDCDVINECPLRWKSENSKDDWKETEHTFTKDCYGNVLNQSVFQSSRLCQTINFEENKNWTFQIAALSEDRQISSPW